MCDILCNTIKPFLESQLFGVIIGSILTGGFTWFIEWRKSIGEQRIRLKEKREETYTMMLKAFQSLRNHYLKTKEFNIPDEIYINFEEICIALKMYASSNIKSKFESFLDELEKDYRHKNNNGEAYEKAMQCMNELSTMVRKELETEVA